MAQLILKRGNYAGLADLAIADGQLIFVKDTNSIYADIGTERIKFSDVVQVATSSALPANGNAGQICIVSDINALGFWNGTGWTQLNVDTGATSVEVTGAGNAITSASYDATTRKITLNKGETFATKAEVDGVDTRLQAAEKKLESVATTEGLGELAEAVAGHTTAIDTINGTVETAGSMLNIAKAAADGKDAAIKEAKDAADKAQGDVDTLAQTHATDKGVLEGAIALKANTADVYNKDEIDGKVDTINGAIELKANASDVYTKTQIDEKVTALEGADEAINNKIGTVTAGKTVVEMISDAQTAATYNDTEVRGLINTNAQAIAQEKTDREGAVSGLKTELEGKIGEKVAQTAYDTKVAALESEDGRLAGLISAMDEAYKEADNGLSGRIAALESDITGLSGAMHFKGVKDTLPESTDDYNDGDTIIVGNKEYVVNGEAFVELGDVSAEVQRISDLEAVVNGTGEGEAHVDGLVDKVADNAAAIVAEKERAEAKEAELVKADTDNLQAAKDYADAAVEALNIGDYAKQADLESATGRITTAEGKITALETASATHALKTDVEAVSTALNEYKEAHKDDYTNAQVDAAIKVVADDLKDYEEAHASDYTNEQINNAIANAGHASATDLATHTGNADIHVTTDDKEKWNKAQENAEATAAAALATARTEISAEIDADVKAEADRAKGIESGLQTAIDTINNTETGILAQAKADATSKANTAETNAKAYTDGLMSWGEF